MVKIRVGRGAGGSSSATATAAAVIVVPLLLVSTCTIMIFLCSASSSSSLSSSLSWLATVISSSWLRCPAALDYYLLEQLRHLARQAQAYFLVPDLELSKLIEKLAIYFAPNSFINVSLHAYIQFQGRKW